MVQIGSNRHCSRVDITCPVPGQMCTFVSHLVTAPLRRPPRGGANSGVEREAEESCSILKPSWALDHALLVIPSPCCPIDNPRSVSPVCVVILSLLPFRLLREQPLTVCLLPLM